MFRDTNGKGKERSTGASDGELELAKKEFETFKAESHTPTFRDGRPDQVLMATVFSYYVEKVIDAGKIMRADTARAAFRNLGEFLGKMSAAEITDQIGEDYVNWRTARGDARGSNKWHARDPNKSRELKPSTAWNDIRFLTSALKFAWENKKLSHQIHVKLTDKAYSEKRIGVLTPCEAARLLRGALGWDQHSVRHRGDINYLLARFILIGLRTGTRKDRILRMQWVESFENGWIDLENCIVHRKGIREPGTKKSAPDFALVDVAGPAVKKNRLLMQLRRWRRLSTMFAVEQNSGRGCLNLDAAFKWACELAGLPTGPVDNPKRITPHTLRHTCAILWLDHGMSCWDVGQSVGMTAAMVESRYGHGSLDKQRASRIGAAQREPKSQMSHRCPTEMRKRA
jgi:integrase